MKIYEIVEGWKPLFVGANKQITNGITVKSINHDPVKDRGIKEQFHINDYTFCKCPSETKEKLGLSDTEYEKYIQSLEFLVDEQKKKV
jgi:hypothetical protein